MNTDIQLSTRLFARRFVGAAVARRRGIPHTGIIATILFAAAMFGATAPAQGPAANASKKPASGSAKAAESSQSKPAAVSEAPSISGRWKARSWFQDALGDFDEIDILVRAPDEYTLAPKQTEPNADPVFSIPIKWVAGTRKFEATYNGPQTNHKMSMQLARGGQTMRVTIEVDEATKKAFAARGMSESDIDELLNQEWTRKPQPLPQFVDTAHPLPPIEKVLEPTEHMELVQGHSKLLVCGEVIQRVSVADQAVVDVVQFSPREFSLIGRAAGSTTLTVWFDQRAEPVIYFINVLRERSATGVEFAAAKPLVEQLAAREAAATAEAATIRQLQAKKPAAENQTAIAEHQRQLTTLLNAAFDLKLQLEELQVRELQSRLSRIDRQIGQRKQLRDKIIARRATQLIDGEALQWAPLEPHASTRDTNPADMTKAMQKPSEQTVPLPAIGQSASPLSPQADRTVASAAAPPSTEKLREQLQPFTERIAYLQARVRESETVYFRDRSNAAELQRAWGELCDARAELRLRLSPVEQIISELNDEIEESRKLYDALTQQHDSKIELLAKGEATEAEVKSASTARKRVDEAMAVADARLQDYMSMLGELSPAGFDGAAFYHVRTDSRPSYDSITALTWLEASLGLKLEFVRFDDLKLPCKAALRVREASDGRETGDLLVAIHGRLFESLDQAVAAQVDESNQGFNRGAGSTILRGGLAGRADTVHFRSSQDRTFLTPSAGSGVGNAIIHFEIRIRDDKGDKVTTAYPQGVCVALDGLVVVPIAANSLVEGERIIVCSGNGSFEGTARVVGSDEKHVLTLLKLESPKRKLHEWVKCRVAMPVANQRLCFVNNSSYMGLAVTAVGQKYVAPREGNDAFLIEPTYEVPIGLPFMSLDDELQGILISTGAPKLANCCLPAVHIQKLLDDYRAGSPGR